MDRPRIRLATQAVRLLCARRGAVILAVTARRPSRPALRPKTARTSTSDPGLAGGDAVREAEAGGEGRGNQPRTGGAGEAIGGLQAGVKGSGTGGRRRRLWLHRWAHERRREERDLAASLGLTPRDSSTPDKERLGAKASTLSSRRPQPPGKKVSREPNRTAPSAPDAPACTPASPQIRGRLQVLPRAGWPREPRVRPRLASTFFSRCSSISWSKIWPARSCFTPRAARRYRTPPTRLGCLSTVSALVRPIPSSAARIPIPLLVVSLPCSCVSSILPAHARRI